MFLSGLKRGFEELHLLTVKVGIVEKVTIDIHSYLDARMTKLGLDVFDVLPRDDPDACVRVPEGMK